MTLPARKLVAVGLQQTFLHMVLDQLRALFGSRVESRSLALNQFQADPPGPDETILYFNQGLRAMVEKMAPRECHFILARREALVFNMQKLFGLPGACRILVVNDVRTNTDEMTRELRRLGLPHDFLPYYPDAPLPEGIDYVVTAGERMLVPRSLADRPLIDIGLRFISLETVYELSAHFGLSVDHAALAKHYMATMLAVSEKWPVLGRDRLLPGPAGTSGAEGGTRSGRTAGKALNSGPDRKAMEAVSREIARHGFLDESRAILAIYRAGKKRNRALGRSAVLEELRSRGWDLSVQKLRLKLERMDGLGLLIVRPGRGGTTLSDRGEVFLDYLTRG